MAYIGLKLKFYHTIQYSQPLNLVLFHVIHVRLKCHKDSH